MTSTDGLITPAGLVLAKGTRLPPKWQKTGQVKDAAGRVVYNGKPISVMNVPGTHREKAFGVATQLSTGRQAFIIGGGEDYTEDLIEQAARMHEEVDQYIDQHKALAREKAEEQRQKQLMWLENKRRVFKANPVTMKEYSRRK